MSNQSIDRPIMVAQVTKEECAEFFKLTFKEFLDPLATAHFNVEGTIEFRAMLFVPGMAPFEQQVRLWTCHTKSTGRGGETSVHVSYVKP